MSTISILVKTLLLISVCCQSLGIYEYTPNYENYSGHNKKTKNNILGSNYPTTISNQTGYISNILNPSNTNNYHRNINPVQYQVDNFAHNSRPYQYEYFNPIQTTSAAVSEQPVAAVSIESELTHAPLIAVKSPKGAIQISPVNYNNEIHHHRINKKEASPLANNAQKDLEFIVREEKNFKNNHNKHDDDDDGKLIEQSIVKDDGFDDLDAASSLSSTNQPSSSESTSIASHEIRYLHDIFLNYPKPHHVNAGHVELSPNLFEKRFETLKAGNRYKGEVMWLDNTGGYAQHFWDLAQGKL